MKRWEPLKNGKQEVCIGKEYFIVQSNGRILDVRHRDGDSSWPLTLYSDIRLCRLVESAHVGVPADIAQTIRGALHGVRLDWDGTDAECESIKRSIDAALAWLEQQEACNGS